MSPPRPTTSTSSPVRRAARLFAALAGLAARAAAVLTVAALAGLASRAASPVELLANPDLDGAYAPVSVSNANGSVSGLLPSGWLDNSLFAGTHTRTEYAEDRNVVSSGSALRATTELQPGYTTGAGFQIYQPVSVGAGRTYAARVRLRAAGPTVVQFRIKQSASPYAVRTSVNCDVGRDWREFTFSYASPAAEALRLDVQSANQPPNTVWIDGLGFALLDALREWHVAPGGADDAPGTRERPFRTLAAAVQVLQPGDSLLLRAGTYRETLQLTASGTAAAPISIRAHPGEVATLSACDVVAGPWTPASGGIHSAAVDWDLGTGYNQVFVDGDMLHEARHPNHGSGDLLQPATAAVTMDASHRVTAKAFASLGDLTGARFLGGIGQAWAWQTATVTANNGGTLSLDPATASSWWWPNYANRTSDAGVGFVYGALSLLDADGEWHLQARAAPPHTLHLRIAGGASPGAHLVELKRRAWCIDLNGRSHVQVSGLRLRGGAVRLSGTGLALDSCDVRHASHFLTFRSGSASNGGRSEGAGVVVDGTGNTVRGCTIHDTAGSGIVAGGRAHLLTRNHIHHIDYSGTYAAPVVLSGEGHAFTFNTVHDAGRDILRPSAPGSSILYNDLSGCGRLCRDLGVVYAWGTDAMTASGARTRVAYNWIHDGNPADPLSKGVYLDNGTRNFQVDHNVIWGFGTPAARTTGIRLNAPADGHELHHNTLFDCLPYNIETYSNYPETNSDPSHWNDATHHLTYRAFNNLVASDPASALEAPASRDFRPRAGSRAVDPPQAPKTIRWTSPDSASGVPPGFKLSIRTKGRAFTYEEQAGQGIRLPGINDGFIGSGPDDGAYERGGPAWTPGVEGSAAAETPPPVENNPVQLANLSIRAALDPDDTLIAGFVVAGGARRLLLRAAGPALAAYGVSGTMQNPTLELYQSGRLLSANDDWQLPLMETFRTAGAFAFAAGSGDAALEQGISDSATAHTSGAGGGTVLVEAYALADPATAGGRLANLSARHRVGGRAGVLIAGFVLSGQGDARVLLRAVGPGLGPYGVKDLLGDPRLALFAADGRLLRQNDDWTSELVSEFARLGAFPLSQGSRDAALLLTLPPGTYSAVVSAPENAQGTALVEIYDAR